MVYKKVFIKAFVSLIMLSACGTSSYPTVTLNGSSRPTNAIVRGQSNLSDQSDMVLDRVAQYQREYNFSIYDTNRSETLTPEEFTSSGFAKDYSFSEFDTDNNNIITLSEYDNFLRKTDFGTYSRNGLRNFAQTFWRLTNKDGDGFVNIGELRDFFVDHNTRKSLNIPMIELTQQSERFMAIADLDVDQKLSFSEYESGLARNYTKTNTYAAGINAYPFPSVR